MNSPVIVVIAFDRIQSIKRLLTSLSSARYPHKNVTLVISIDRAPYNKDVLTFADNYEWTHGTKRVVYQTENLGLRKHIIKCMDYAISYGSMILLEDDLLVSPEFYNFSTQALNFSTNKSEIAGISLYNHQFNVHVAKNFSAINDGYDNWYFQFASSWGQAWSKSHIIEFLEWYSTNPNIEEIESVPAYVRSWPDTSWLKYFIGFVIDKNRFFIYPHLSLTTNFGDEGTHMATQTTCFQVPITIGNDGISSYNFSTLSMSKAVYDAYFENLKLNEYLDDGLDNVLVDLYGYKTVSKNTYLLSSQKLQYRILKSYGKNLKPRDTNIVYKIEGNDFHLYDTSTEEKNIFETNELKSIMYQIKYVTLSNIFVLLHSFIMMKIKSAFIKLSPVKR